ncbi:MAG TPA: ankyrin repeat domain-containing protein [Candidatus Saccharimonadales bacterium]|nr:ankyrin repeat domain-containing protein [Candidatus Saccharimonadales bacterium]
MKKIFLYSFLLLQTLSINASTKEIINLELLRNAIKDNKTDIAMQIIQNPEFYKLPKANTESIFRLAARYNNIEIVKKLLEKPGYVFINAANASGETALYLAAENGYLEMVKFFLADPRISINLVNRVGATPLFTALYNGHLEVAKLFLANPQITINNAIDTSKVTCLYLAASRGYSEIVKLLLANPRIDVNKANINGATPLYIAAAKGYIEVVQLLLEVPGIDINKAPINGATPLYIAAQNNYISIVRLFLKDQRIDVNKSTTENISPLYVAAFKGHIEIVKLFLADRKTEINKARVDGTTAFFMAVQLRHIEIVKLFLANHATDINKARNDGATPLYIAVEAGDIEMVKLLLADPAIDIDKADNRGVTPMYVAREFDRREIVNLLERYQTIMALKTDRNALKRSEELSNISPEAHILRVAYLDFFNSPGVNIEPFNATLFERLKDHDAIKLMKEIFNPEQIVRLIIIFAKDEKYGNSMKQTLKNYAESTVAQEMRDLTPEQQRLKKEEIDENQCLICLSKQIELESDNAMLRLTCCKGTICADCIKNYDFPEDKCPHCREKIKF